MNLPPTPESEGAILRSQALERLYRREKRAFWWACGWLGALIVAWAGGSAFAYFAHKRMAEMIASASVDQMPDLVDAQLTYFSRILPWLRTLQALLIFCAVGFIVCLVHWLLAIHRRRKLLGSIFEP